MPQLSRTWRFVVTNLAGATITMLDHLATDRTVTPVLGDALKVTGIVPSDSPEVNLLHTDGFPFLAEGVRQLYCFRDEADIGDPVNYVIRASTLLMQIDDAAQEDDATSTFTGFDPWQYLMSRPVLVSDNTPNGVGSNGEAIPLPAGTVAGDIIPYTGILYPASMRADEIVMDMITTTVDFGDPTQPLAALNLFIDHGQFGGSSTNIQEHCSTFTPDGYPIQQGTSLGQALKDIMDTGYLDIVFRPIYDVANRPGILCAIEIYKQDLSGTLGAGSYNYSAVFAWDRPGRSLVGVDDMFDGTGRANTVQFYTGQGGPPVPRETDPDSIARYGEYWSQQFFPATLQNEPAVVGFAAMQIALRSRYKQTLTVNPAPERAPEPFVDYYLGDAVPEFMSDNMRQALPIETLSAGVNAANSGTVNVSSTGQFATSGALLIGGVLTTYTGKTTTSFTGCSSHPATAAGETITGAAWQRVYGIPVEIDDNGVETVRELLVGPVGAPP